MGGYKLSPLPFLLSHVLSGVLAALFLIHYHMTGYTPSLVLGLVSTLAFHAYEVSQYHMMRDKMYLQLLEHYIGLLGGLGAYLVLFLL